MDFRSFATPLIACLLALASLARAEDVSGCDKFKWSVTREGDWFAAKPEAAEPGAALLASRAYAIALKPGAAANFAIPPERESKPEAFAGTATFAIDAPGLYQVTLSTEAWIDGIQGARVKSVDFSGQKACAGVRKSVRFMLGKGLATVQVSNAESDMMLIAVAPAP